MFHRRPVSRMRPSPAFQDFRARRSLILIVSATFRASIARQLRQSDPSPTIARAEGSFRAWFLGLCLGTSKPGSATCPESGGEGKPSALPSAEGVPAFAGLSLRAAVPSERLDNGVRPLASLARRPGVVGRGAPDTRISRAQHEFWSSGQTHQANVPGKRGIRGTCRVLALH